MQLLPASPQNLIAALAVLQNGGIVVHATETCYGMACDLTNTTAVARLFAIKKRPETMPVSGLFRGIEHAKEYVSWTSKAQEFANLHLPGPLTLILPVRTDIPIPLYPTPGGGATVGVRISSNEVALELAAAFGRPLSTTSANIHGEANPYDARAIAKRFEEEAFQPDLILDSGVLPQVPPSTVVDLTGGGVVRVGPIRVGP